MTGPTDQRLKFTARAGHLSAAWMFSRPDLTGWYVAPIPDGLTRLERVRRTLAGVRGRSGQNRGKNQQYCSSAHIFPPWVCLEVSLGLSLMLSHAESKRFCAAGRCGLLRGNGRRPLADRGGVLGV